MGKFTARRIVLALAACVLALITFLSLFFPVISMELEGAIGAPDGADTAENGFDLLYGESITEAQFRTLVDSISEEYHAGLSLTDTSAMMLCVRILCWAVLLGSALMLGLSLGWLFFSKKDGGEGVLRAVAVFAVLFGVAYTVAGLLYTVSFNNSWQELWDRLTSGTYDASRYAVPFSTAAYVPLLLILALEIVFWILYFCMRDKSAALLPIQVSEDAADLYQSDVLFMPSGKEHFSGRAYRGKGRFNVKSLAYLRELKSLFDEGILTEEEFEREKEKFLNR